MKRLKGRIKGPQKWEQYGGKYKKIDAANKILGRLVSYIAKRSLMGEHFVVVNAKNAMIIGDPHWVIHKFIDRQEKHTLSQPTHGPFWPHRPDTLIRRALRGMLPKNARGQLAKKRVQVFISDIPYHLKSKYPIEGEQKVPKADYEKSQHAAICLGELAGHIGWKGRRE